MVKLNLGCGPYGMMDWINYDLVTKPGSNVIALDLSTGKIPKVDNSVDFIFSEHFIEHITREQAQQLLKDCFRVLKPGGRIRLSTPDLEAWARDYLLGKVSCFPGVWEPASACQMLNEGLRLWGHLFLYDQTELAQAFRSAGFRSPLRRGWRESGVSELQQLEVRPFYNDLIMEAFKE